MRNLYGHGHVPLLVATLLTLICNPVFSFSDKNSKGGNEEIQVGVRPYFLVKDMDESPLKETLESCRKGPFKRTDFSIGHRGAPLQFPEHTRESYEAAARMGAGILECDVTFTSDQELVCRHSQCDLHTTTNILETPLAAKCSEPFKPAEFDADGNLISPASAQCCTSDITVEEFKSLQGRMEAGVNPLATSAEQFQAIPDWRTTLYSNTGTLMTHSESIELFQKLGVKMTPELKSPSVPMPFNGFSQQDYAAKMIEEYLEAGVNARNVWAQSFSEDDVLYWINNYPGFGEQAVYLDDRYDTAGFDHRNSATWNPSMSELYNQGVRIIAPPMWMLVEVENGEIVPSKYAIAAKSAGLEIITWTLERSGPLAGGGGWYYQTLNGLNSSEASVINNDGDMLNVLDVLAKDVGILAIFSDWAGTATYYANCMQLK